MNVVKFNFKELVDLNEDLKQSPKALRVIIQRVMALHLRKLARQMKPGIPRGTSGKLAASFGSSVRRRGDGVSALIGFMTGKRVSASTAIAGNVMQKPGATARKRENLWIPTMNNRAAGGGAIVTPQQFFSMPGTFVKTVSGGKKIGFVRQGDALMPLFVLQKTVRMPQPPLNIESNVEGALPEIMNDVKATIGEVLAARGAVIRQAGL